MPAPKNIKEDPPEIKSKVDKVKEKPVVEVKEEPAFKEAPTPAVSAEDVVRLMEQNRVLMAKVEELTAKPEEKVKERPGGPVLDTTKPIIYQRAEGAAWKEQEGNRFTHKGKFIGPVRKK